MDNLKIGIGVLGRRLGRSLREILRDMLCGVRCGIRCGACVTASALVASVGCQHTPTAVVPARAALSASLVVNASDEFSDRNDACLGLTREPTMRLLDRATVETIDTQYIFNGRPYQNYSSSSRSTERFAR